VPAHALGELGLRPEAASITRRNGERINRIEAWMRPDALPIEVTRKLQQGLADSGFHMAPGCRLEPRAAAGPGGRRLGLPRRNRGRAGQSLPNPNQAVCTWQIAGIKQAQASLASGEGIPFDEVMAEMDVLTEQKAQER
jgi:hypothetical protein